MTLDLCFCCLVYCTKRKARTCKKLYQQYMVSVSTGREKRSKKDAAGWTRAHWHEFVLQSGLRFTSEIEDTLFEIMSVRTHGKGDYIPEIDFMATWHAHDLESKDPFIKRMCHTYKMEYYSLTTEEMLQRVTNIDQGCSAFDERLVTREQQDGDVTNNTLPDTIIGERRSHFRMYYRDKPGKASHRTHALEAALKRERDTPTKAEAIKQQEAASPEDGVEAGKVGGQDGAGRETAVASLVSLTDEELTVWKALRERDESCADEGDTAEAVRLEFSEPSIPSDDLSLDAQEFMCSTHRSRDSPPSSQPHGRHRWPRADEPPPPTARSASGSRPNTHSSSRAQPRTV